MLPRTTRLLGSSLATAIVAVACLGASSASAALPETFQVDTYSTAPGPFVNPTQGTTSLTREQPYVVQVQGTMSLWTAYEWGSPRWRTCNGEAEESPVTPSPNRSNGPVGIDAETRFAPLFETEDPCPATPQGFGNFQISSDGAFGHPSPLASSDAATHTYRYPVRGADRTLGARFIDPAPQDNYGIFTVTVGTPAPADCANGGSVALGFPSEQACVEQTTAAASTSTPVSNSAASTSSPVPPALDSGASAVAAATASKICGSKRAFNIRIVEKKKRPIRSARVTYLGRSVKAKRRKSDKRLIAKIDLRNRPTKRFSVFISVTYKNGKKAKGVRKYYTCSARKPSKPPKL